jgi:nucleoside-diphosphate-sugar epimerase
VKVVVTGGLGKLGRWVVDELLTARAGRCEYDVIVFDRAGSEAPQDARRIHGDIQDLDQVARALDGADAVVHLASVPTNGLVPDEQTFGVNVMGTFNVYEAAHRSGVPRVVTVGSEAVLGWAPSARNETTAPRYFPIDEEHPTEPQDTYGLSKLVVETIARSYAARSNLVTVVLRPPWILEPHELEHLREQGGVVPEAFSLLHYVDARDLARACRCALEQPLVGCHVLFVGSGESLAAEPLSSLLPRLRPQLGRLADSLEKGGGSVSVARAAEVLNWRPQHFWRED